MTDIKNAKNVEDYPIMLNSINDEAEYYNLMTMQLLGTNIKLFYAKEHQKMNKKSNPAQQKEFPPYPTNDFMFIDERGQLGHIDNAKKIKIKPMKMRLSAKFGNNSVVLHAKRRFFQT